MFDYDTASPINVGDESWYIGFSGTSFVMTGDFVATVDLTAGTHTVKIQWLTASGTLYTADTLHNWKIQGTLVSGSGAGGIIKIGRAHV